MRLEEVQLLQVVRAASWKLGVRLLQIGPYRLPHPLPKSQVRLLKKVSARTTAYPTHYLSFKSGFSKKFRSVPPTPSTT
jgi:hypothetical protein